MQCTVATSQRYPGEREPSIYGNKRVQNTICWTFWHKAQWWRLVLLCKGGKKSTAPPWQLAPPFASSQPRSLRWSGGGVTKAREEVFLMWCKGKSTHMPTYNPHVLLMSYTVICQGYFCEKKTTGVSKTSRQIGPSLQVFLFSTSCHLCIFLLLFWHEHAFKLAVTWAVSH